MAVEDETPLSPEAKGSEKGEEKEEKEEKAVESDDKEEKDVTKVKSALLYQSRLSSYDLP